MSDACPMPLKWNCFHYSGMLNECEFMEEMECVYSSFSMFHAQCSVSLRHIILQSFQDKEVKEWEGSCTFHSSLSTSHTVYSMWRMPLSSSSPSFSVFVIVSRHFLSVVYRWTGFMTSFSFWQVTSTHIHIHIPIAGHTTSLGRSSTFNELIRLKISFSKHLYRHRHAYKATVCVTASYFVSFNFRSFYIYTHILHHLASFNGLQRHLICT